MTRKRFFLLLVLMLLLYLGMYTWNQRTGILDTLAVRAGLESAGVILRPLHDLESVLHDTWRRYINLVGVQQENERLKAELAAVQARMTQAGEERAELLRLRDLLSLRPGTEWNLLGTRVLAGRMGPNSIMQTIIIDRGYLTGGAPGTPLVTPLGLVGRVLRASAHTASVLLLTNPDSRIAVLGQDCRETGILTGCGSNRPLEVRFVARGAQLKPGELLITSGQDGVYPKGIPVARVLRVDPPAYSQFLEVTAEVLVAAEHLEEALLLESVEQLPPASAQAARKVPGTTSRDGYQP